jgi:dynein intermediate chain
MQQRKDEILAKKAKLAELKRQRELRQKEFTQRGQVGEGSSDVLQPKCFCSAGLTIHHS